MKMYLREDDHWWIINPDGSSKECMGAIPIRDRGDLTVREHSDSVDGDSWVIDRAGDGYIRPDLTGGRCAKYRSAEEAVQVMLRYHDSVTGHTPKERKNLCINCKWGPTAFLCGSMRSCGGGSAWEPRVVPEKQQEQVPDQHEPGGEINLKDEIGTKKWRQFCTVPFRVLWYVGVAMLEGARKYGRHNYRVAGVRASVYVDASKGHIDQWFEGEDIDRDSGLCHLDKAIASLILLRDSTLQGNWVDDRPPKIDIEQDRVFLQQKVDEIIAKYPDPAEPYTQQGLEEERK